MDLLESEIEIYYNCDECGETFTSDVTLHDHKRIVHMKLYKCQVCDSSFQDVAVLEKHILNTHTKPEPVATLYLCDFCEENFFQKSQLNEHLNEKHSSQKTHTCKECDKTFFSNIGLKHHVRVIHKSIRHYSCPDCSQSFRRESTLERHIDREHLKLNKESLFYKCDECGKTLPSGCLFHVCKNEIPLTCEECGDSFSNSIDFKDHKKMIHPKHLCIECKVVYSSSDTLQAHIRRDHVKKPIDVKQANSNVCVKKHKCDYCVIAFARPENLRRHVQRMHKSKD